MQFIYRVYPLQNYLQALHCHWLINHVVEACANCKSEVDMVQYDLVQLLQCSDIQGSCLPSYTDTNSKACANSAVDCECFE